MEYNEAACTQYAFFIPTSWISNNCGGVTSVTAWRSHVGVMLQDQKCDFELSDSLIVDCDIGFDGNYQFSRETRHVSEYVVNTVFVGKSLAVGACPAVRVMGFVVPSFTWDRKIMAWTMPTPFICIYCGNTLPWESHFTQAGGPFVDVFMENATFSDFSCPSSFALTMHPDEMDLTVPVRGTGFRWSRVPAAQRIWLGTGQRPQFIDLDGTLLGAAAKGMHLLGPGAAPYNIPSCTVDAASGGFLCPVQYGRAQLVNVDMANHNAASRMIGSTLLVITDPSSVNPSGSNKSLWQEKDIKDGPCINGCAAPARCMPGRPSPT
jgi:hypothetical protein